MPERPKVNRPHGPARGAGRKASPAERGYTWRWARAAKVFLAQNPCCHYCGLLGRVVGAEHVDHYNPAPPRSPEFWDPANWRPACEYHNSQKQDTPGDEYEAKLLAEARRGPAPPPPPHP